MKVLKIWTNNSVRKAAVCDTRLLFSFPSAVQRGMSSTLEMWVRRCSILQSQLPIKGQSTSPGGTNHQQLPCPQLHLAEAKFHMSVVGRLGELPLLSPPSCYLAQQVINQASPKSQNPGCPQSTLLFRQWFQAMKCKPRIPEISSHALCQSERNWPYQCTSLWS